MSGEVGSEREVWEAEHGPLRTVGEAVHGKLLALLWPLPLWANPHMQWWDRWVGEADSQEEDLKVKQDSKTSCDPLGTCVSVFHCTYLKGR